MTLFARRLADELGEELSETTVDYSVVMDLIRALSYQYRSDPVALQAAAVRVLDSLFPSWLPGAFAAMFSRPLPSFATWINAVVTVAVTQWLMGPSRMADDGSHTVEIERCRYLEESGCVGVCINSCKNATESFFTKSMGLPLYIEPCFDD